MPLRVGSAGTEPPESFVRERASIDAGSVAKQNGERHTGGGGVSIEV